MAGRSRSDASRILISVIPYYRVSWFRAAYAAFATFGRKVSQGQKSGSNGLPIEARHGRVPVVPCSNSKWPQTAHRISESLLKMGFATTLAFYYI